MGLVLGLVAGVGLLLVWLAVSAPPREERTPRAGRTRQLLDRAGLAGTSSTGLVGLCAACGFVAFVAVELLSRTMTVAVAFALLGGLPAGRGRVRARPATPARAG